MRSPLAHARIRGIHVPERYRDSVFTAADLAGVNPIRAVSGLPGFKISEQPVLATGKVRQVGELVAMCVAPTRAEAEDIAAAVTLDLEELPAVYDMLKAREPGSALVHEHWGDNVFLETNFEVDISSGAGCADQGDARDIDRAAMHVAARRPRRRRDLRSPPRSAHALFLGPDAAYHAQRPCRMPRHGAGPHPHHFARCRRRLRAQGHPAAGRSLPVVADDAPRPSGALDRGSPRASHRQLQLPRAPLQDHRLCRSRRPAARHRLRSDRRFRRLLVLSVLGVP